MSRIELQNKHDAFSTSNIVQHTINLALASWYRCFEIHQLNERLSGFAKVDFGFSLSMIAWSLEMVTQTLVAYTWFSSIMRVIGDKSPSGRVEVAGK